MLLFCLLTANDYRTLLFVRECVPNAPGTIMMKHLLENKSVTLTTEFVVYSQLASCLFFSSFLDAARVYDIVFGT